MSASRSAKSSSGASGKGSKHASGASVKGVSSALQSTSDSAHHASAVPKTWRSGEKNSYVIQMKEKLKKHGEYNECGENELLDEAKKLISEDDLYLGFSHLIQGNQEEVIMEATQFDGAESYANELEREAAKRRELERFNRLAKLKFTICLQEIGKGEPSIHKDKTIISIANIMSMDYSGRHAAILVDDILLEWNTSNLVIPRIVCDSDIFMFEGSVKKTGEFFNGIALNKPRLTDNPNNFEEEGRILCRTLAMKTELIKKIIAVIVKYNSCYYYNAASRNCQHFVKAILKAAGIENPNFSPENQEYLKLAKEGKMRVPQSFKNHEDIDDFVMNLKDRKELNKHELDQLIRAYDAHHGAENCRVPTCKFQLLLATLADSK